MDYHLDLCGLWISHIAQTVLSTSTPFLLTKNFVRTCRCPATGTTISIV